MKTDIAITPADYTREQLDIIKNSVAKGTTDNELKYFLAVCRAVQLNPLLKEIWCYKDTKNNLLVFAGRDGFLSYAQRNPQFAGIRSCDVCENDLLELDVMNPANNRHIIAQSNRGKILGAYALVFRKEGEPTLSYVEFAAYNRGVNTWKTHPAAMIKKVAETQALKLAFGMSSVQSEYEFDNTPQGIVVPIDHVVTQDDLEEVRDKIAAATNNRDLARIYSELAPEYQSREAVLVMFKAQKEKINATGN